MFNIGDKFIHFTKYGGINKGEVAEIRDINVWDTENLCIYLRYSIFTTNGVSLNLDGSDGKIYKIEKEIEPEQAKNFSRVMKKASAKKSRPNNQIIHELNEN